jgi:hypothetical protein
LFLAGKMGCDATNANSVVPSFGTQDSASSSLAWSELPGKGALLSHVNSTCLRTGTVTAAIVGHLVGSGQRLKAAAQSGEITLLARGASDESDTAVALPLIAVSSQNVIGSFEARFFLR